MDVAAELLTRRDLTGVQITEQFSREGQVAGVVAGGDERLGGVGESRASAYGGCRRITHEHESAALTGLHGKRSVFVHRHGVHGPTRLSKVPCHRSTDTTESEDDRGRLPRESESESDQCVAGWAVQLQQEPGDTQRRRDRREDPRGGERPVVGRRWRRQIGRLQEQQPGGFEQELGPIRPSIFRNSPGQADRPEGQRETTGEDGRAWQQSL